jgi:hypothetical protein
MKATLISDRQLLDVYRVESEPDKDGSIQVAVFSGPDALNRAVIFAGGDYYEGWADPEGLSEQGSIGRA